MSITKEEFKRLQAVDDDISVYDKGTNPYTVLEFLAINQDKAFKPKKIAEETDIPPASVRVTLTRLESKGLVEHTKEYWSIDEHELGTERATLLSQRSIDPDRYEGYDRDKETEYSELPPDRQVRDE